VLLLLLLLARCAAIRGPAGFGAMVLRPRQRCGHRQQPPLQLPLASRPRHMRPLLLLLLTLVWCVLARAARVWPAAVLLLLLLLLLL
jgi:hypothetical protein